MTYTPTSNDHTYNAYYYGQNQVHDKNQFCLKIIPNLPLDFNDRNQVKRGGNTRACHKSIGVRNKL